MDWEVFVDKPQEPWASAEFFSGVKRWHFAYLFQVANDAVQMEVHKILYPLHTTKKMPHYDKTRVFKVF